MTDGLIIARPKQQASAAAIARLSGWSTSMTNPSSHLNVEPAHASEPPEIGWLMPSAAIAHSSAIIRDSGGGSKTNIACLASVSLPL
jgi:hypothetical protein